MEDKKSSITHSNGIDCFTIRDLRETFGYGVDTLRYFEKKGLLHPTRGENRYRYYTNDDYWTLNLTRNLRNAGLSVEQIGEYLQHRTLDSTVETLQGALESLERSIRHLQFSAESIREQLRMISELNDALTDIVTVIRYPERKVMLIRENFSTPERFNALKYQLLQKKAQGKYFSLIGVDCVGSVTSSERVMEGDYSVDGAFMFDPDGDDSFPAGNYLSVFYRGGPQNEKYIRMLIDYAARNSIEIEGPFLRIIRSDVLVTLDRSEWAAEVQVRIKD